MHLPDLELVRRAQRGELEAFDLLVRRHETRAVSLAYRLIGDLESAHDAAQDAFVAAWRALPSFRGDAAFSTWLYRIVYNACVDLDKQRRRRAAVSLEDERSPGHGTREQQDGAAGPHELVEVSELQELVRQALLRLPLHHRTIITLFDIQGLTYEEIGSVMRAPLGTVKSRLNRARQALRDELAPLLEHRLCPTGHRDGHARRVNGGDRRELR